MSTTETDPHVAKAEAASDDRDDRGDPLLAALRLLPARPIDGSAETRLQRQARAAYLRSFEGSAWDGLATGIVGRAAVPVFLAGIVGVYMMWAIATATSFFH